MTWTEQTGTHAWRVRYPTSDGHIASISGFTSQKTADDYATDIETDQRRQIWIDPTLGRYATSVTTRAARGRGGTTGSHAGDSTRTRGWPGP